MLHFRQVYLLPSSCDSLLHSVHKTRTYTYCLSIYVRPNSLLAPNTASVFFFIVGLCIFSSRKFLSEYTKAEMSQSTKIPLDLLRPSYWHFPQAKLNRNEEHLSQFLFNFIILSDKGLLIQVSL
jgi:hypothetical protein